MLSMLVAAASRHKGVSPFECVFAGDNQSILNIATIKLIASFRQLGAFGTVVTAHQENTGQIKARFQDNILISRLKFCIVDDTPGVGLDLP